MKVFPVVLLLLVSGACVDAAAGASQMRKKYLILHGQASGGTLVLAAPFGGRARFLEVQTEPGESAESVAAKLAEGIRSKDPFGWRGPGVYAVRAIQVSAEKGKLGPFAAGTLYWFAGTETGLGIPRPPLFLSGSIEEASGRILLDWENPPGGYDEIGIMIHDERGKHRRLGCGGQQTSFAIDWPDAPQTVIHARVIGYKNDLPSSAGVITLRRDAQEELIGAPFVCGLAPNWNSWVWGDGATLRLEQAATDPNGSKLLTDRHTTPGEALYKPFRQVVRLDASPGTAGGVYRKFLGLKPGASYRITAHVAADAEATAAGAWEVSFWARPQAGAAAVEPQLLAGATAAIEDGHSGATRIAVFGPDERIADAGASAATLPLKQVDAVVTLPPGADAILFWTRCQGKVPVVCAVQYIRLAEISSDELKQAR